MRLFIMALAMIYVITPCSRRLFEQDKFEPLQVRIPDYHEKIVIETEQEEFIVKVKEGNCLSNIVEWCLNSYLRINGHQGLFRFKETLYDIVNAVETRSGNPDVIYAGETISLKLPETLKVYRFDYYQEREQVYGLESLVKLLDFRWLIEYNPDEWNCSESAGFVEYYLEDNGYNVNIVATKNHAWCIVEVEPNLWVDVECVSSPPRIRGAIRHYDRRYENIWETVDDMPGEYDWWNRTVDGMIIKRSQF